jgi:general secretion pathway protein G
MKNRKRGFSLVELLIVLAVIAALIATITPVALNAIKKSKATQVAQNLKTLASALENAAYVNGTESDIIQSGSGEVTLDSLGRDIDAENYAVYYTGTNGRYTATVVFKGDGDITMIQSTLATAATGTFETAAVGIPLTGTDWVNPVGDEVIYYRIVFDVY